MTQSPRSIIPTLGDSPTRHPVFWFDDGSIVFRVEYCLFKVHRGLLTRNSTFFAQSSTRNPDGLVDRRGNPDDLHSDDHIVVNPSRKVRVDDVEVLLEHLYHDKPLFWNTPSTPRLISALRVSSPLQLDFPAIHALTREKLNSMFSENVVLPFLRPDNLEETLAVATEYQITPMRKILYYSLVTSPESKGAVEGAIEPIHDGTNANAPQKSQLPQADADICAQLMTHLIDHFTPILFTPPATAHMACTDVFADTWMARVIQPAIENDGVYKPLETLELMKGMDWKKEGLCDSCVEEKREEWTEEQRLVWRLMDGWLGLN